MAKGLGRGLQALFPDQGDHQDDIVLHVPLTELRANPYQPRKVFTEEAISELADSIREHGVLQPIIARKSIKGYEIVVGERRFKAAKKAGLSEVPVVVKELDDQKMMELALIENLQREDLNPIEEALAYDKLMRHLSMTQEQVATRVGKSRPHIANHLRLLHLPSTVQNCIQEGKLTMGHGRALLGLNKKDMIPAVLEKVLKDKLSVREVEELVHTLNEKTPREKKGSKVSLSPILKERQDALRRKLGTSVSIKPGKKKGKIEIDYFSEDDLERIIYLLGSTEEDSL